MTGYPRTGDLIYCAQPLYHSAGMMACLLSFKNGGGIAIGRRFSARNFFRECTESGATGVGFWLDRSDLLFLGTDLDSGVGTLFRSLWSVLASFLLSPPSPQMMYIGEICRYLLATPPSEWDTKHRVQFCIGNGLRADIFKEFYNRFNKPTICEFYGWVFFSRPSLNLNHNSSLSLRHT